MPPRSALQTAGRYLRDALAQGLIAEPLMKAYAIRAMLEMGHDENTTRAAVNQKFREDFGIMGAN